MHTSPSTRDDRDLALQHLEQNFKSGDYVIITDCERGDCLFEGWLKAKSI